MKKQIYMSQCYNENGLCLLERYLGNKLDIGTHHKPAHRTDRYYFDRGAHYLKKHLPSLKQYDTGVRDDLARFYVVDQKDWDAFVKSGYSEEKSVYRVGRKYYIIESMTDAMVDGVNNVELVDVADWKPSRRRVKV